MTVHLSIILVINLMHKFLFHNKFIIRLYMFRALCAHHQVKIVLYRVIEKMDGIWNRYNLESTRRIYTFGILKCSEKFNVLDLP